MRTQILSAITVLCFALTFAFAQEGATKTAAVQDSLVTSESDYVLNVFHFADGESLPELTRLNHKNKLITDAENVMLLRALLSILYIARFLGFEGFFFKLLRFSATEPISSLFRDKALAL